VAGSWPRASKNEGKTKKKEDGGKMLQNLFEDLQRLLATNPKFLVDDVLSKDKVAESALALEPELLEMLLKENSLKAHFFEKSGSVLVFDKVKFQKFILNKDFLPDNYTAFRNKVGLVSNDEYITESSDVVLVWPYKDSVLEGGQDKDDAKRTEIFWNLTLAPDQISRLLSPKALKNIEKFGSNGKSVKVEEISDRDNLLIRGNNLLTLHTLKERYRNKVKLIYIDPPYNPDSKNNTFTYNNSFNRSTWLTFMKNRLEVAREFMAQDGSLIVAIDENEQAHLGVLLKEMFRDYEVHCITIVHNPRGVQGTNFSYTHEYAFFVIPRGKKSISSTTIEEGEVDWSNLRNWGAESERSDAKNCFYPIIVENGRIVGFGDVEPDNSHPKQNTVKGKQIYVYPIDINGIERKWRYARQSVDAIAGMLKTKQVAERLEIEIGKTFGTFKTVWQNKKYDANVYGSQILKDLVPDSEFLFPKSLWNVYDCISAVVGEDKDAIVMDFFGGSGTTAHAVLELNKTDGGQRRFILCEQMDYVETVTKERIRQVILRNESDSFIYAELADANEEFVRKIKNSNSLDDLSKIWTEMQERAFLSHRATSVVQSSTTESLNSLNKQEFATFLLEILDHNMLYVPFSEIDDEQYGLDQATRNINKKMFS
jgi:adenine-specific DNA-methyltransferase